MACVAHDKTDVVRSGELDCGLYIGSVRGFDGVVDVVAELARSRLWCEGIAALVGEEGLHDRHGRVHAEITCQQCSRDTIEIPRVGGRKRQRVKGGTYCVIGCVHACFRAAHASAS